MRSVVHGAGAAGGVDLTGTIRPVGGAARPGGSSPRRPRRGTGTIEADHLGGEIVPLGRGHGVPAPVDEPLRRPADRMARESLRPAPRPDEFMAAPERPVP